LEEGAFSGVVSVRQGEVPVLEMAHGLAQRAEGIPNALRTRFGMASGSKVFTAVAVCRLVEEGELAFDDRLVDLVGDLTWVDPAVTLHHLLSHTSGVPDYFDEEVLDDYEALWQQTPTYTMRRPRDFLTLFPRGEMKFSPGERFAYSNGGFVLLGLAVEEVTDRPFTEYVAEEVLGLAGMESSGYFAMDRLPASTAYGYVEEDGGWRTNFFSVPVVGGGDGGAFTTAGDMERFWRALLEHRLLKIPTTRRMLTPHASVDEGYAYGYGVWMAETPVGWRYYVIGEDPGVSMGSSYYPSLDVVVTVLCNTADGAWDLYRVLRTAIEGD
jgi:CubicO group peptidase (beta-lactamase class C family)